MVITIKGYIQNIKKLGGGENGELGKGLDSGPQSPGVSLFCY